jgi:succinoglycan biosynthesis transport protein ExoP
LLLIYYLLEKSNKVLFIEADIRRPSVLNGFYQFDRKILGLGEIISGSANLKMSIFKVPGTELNIIRLEKKDLICQILLTKNK